MADYSDKQKQEAWEMALPINGLDCNVWRTDPCGALIHRNHFGLKTEFGWNIDHIIPKSLCPSNDYDAIPNNRRAMHWENNECKANQFPDYYYSVTHKDGHNIRIRKKRIYINEDTITILLKNASWLKIYISGMRYKWVNFYGEEQHYKKRLFFICSNI